MCGASRKDVSKWKKHKQLWESSACIFKRFTIDHIPEKDMCYMVHDYLYSSPLSSKTCDLSFHVWPKKRWGGWHFLWRRHPCQYSCLRLSSHLISLSSLLLLFPLSLAPALLMIPRKEADFTWGSNIIFSPLLCHFLLFVIVFHWNLELRKSMRYPRNHYHRSFTQTSEAWKKQIGAWTPCLDFGKSNHLAMMETV